MAIFKSSKNCTIIVKNNYTGIASKFSKTAEEIKVEATKENLMLNCIKKITASGNKTGSENEN